MFYKNIRSHQKSSIKKVLLQISQNSHENTCARVSFLIRPATLLKRRLWHRFFRWILRNLLEHLFSQNISVGCFCVSINFFIIFGIHLAQFVTVAMLSNQRNTAFFTARIPRMKGNSSRKILELLTKISYP